MKNTFSKKSNTLKYFLLGCANAAMLTALSGEALGDIGLMDIIGNKKPSPEFEALAYQQQKAAILAAEQDPALVNEPNNIKKQINLGRLAQVKIDVDKKSPAAIKAAEIAAKKAEIAAAKKAAAVSAVVVYPVGIPATVVPAIAAAPSFGSSSSSNCSGSSATPRRYSESKIRRYNRQKN